MKKDLVISFYPVLSSNDTNSIFPHQYLEKFDKRRKQQMV